MAVRIIDKSANHLKASVYGAPVRVPLYFKNTYMCTSVDEIAGLPREGIEGTIKDSSDPDINMPCAIGSEALVKTGEIFFLWPDNTWGVF